MRHHLVSAQIAYVATAQSYKLRDPIDRLGKLRLYHKLRPALQYLAVLRTE